MTILDGYLYLAVDDQVNAYKLPHFTGRLPPSPEDFFPARPAFTLKPSPGQVSQFRAKMSKAEDSATDTTTGTGTDTDTCSLRPEFNHIRAGLLDNNRPVLVAVGELGLICAWDLVEPRSSKAAADRLFFAPKPESTWGISFNAQSGLLFVSSNAHCISVFDYRSGECYFSDYEEPHHRHNIPSLDSRGHWLVSAGIDQRCILWNFKDPRNPTWSSYKVDNDEWGWLARFVDVDKQTLPLPASVTMIPERRKPFKLERNYFDLDGLGGSSDDDDNTDIGPSFSLGSGFILLNSDDDYDYDYDDYDDDDDEYDYEYDDEHYYEDEQYNDEEEEEEEEGTVVENAHLGWRSSDSEEKANLSRDSEDVDVDSFMSISSNKDSSNDSLKRRHSHVSSESVHSVNACLCAGANSVKSGECIPSEENGHEECHSTAFDEETDSGSGSDEEEIDSENNDCHDSNTDEDGFHSDCSSTERHLGFGREGVSRGGMRMPDEYDSDFDLMSMLRHTGNGGTNDEDSSSEDNLPPCYECVICGQRVQSDDDPHLVQFSERNCHPATALNLSLHSPPFVFLSSSFLTHFQGSRTRGFRIDSLTHYCDAAHFRNPWLNLIARPSFGEWCPALQLLLFADQSGFLYAASLNTANPVAVRLPEREPRREFVGMAVRVVRDAEYGPKAQVFLLDYEGKLSIYEVLRLE